MADEYIDYWEVGEYGGQCVSALGSLGSDATLLNVSALQTQVQSAVSAVNTQMELAGMKRSDLRGHRQTVEEAAVEGRSVIEKFHWWLGSQDDDAPMDREAFFPGMKLGTLAALKPADVRARLEDMVRGFAVPKNAAMPERAARLLKVTTARDAMDAAIAGKGGSSAQKLQSTAGLVAAREAFLVVYNKVAKPMVRGQLVALGREAEMKNFFPDLAVNEGSRKAATSGEPQPTVPQPTEPLPA